MDARQPVPEGIRGVDVDDCARDGPSHPDCQAQPDNHGRPGFPPSHCCCQGHDTLLPHAAAVQLHRCVARGEASGMGREGRLCRLMLTGQPKICFVRSKLAPSTPGQERFNPAGATLAGISRGPNGASKLLLHERGPMGRLGWTGEPECHGQGILGQENKGFSSQRDKETGDRTGEGRRKKERSAHSFPPPSGAYCYCCPRATHSGC